MDPWHPAYLWTGPLSFLAADLPRTRLGQSMPLWGSLSLYARTNPRTVFRATR